MKRTICAVFVLFFTVALKVSAQAETLLDLPGATMFDYMEVLSSKIGSSMTCNGDPDFERNGVWDPYFLCQIYYDVTVYGAVSESNERVSTIQIEPILDVKKMNRGSFVAGWNESGAFDSAAGSGAALLRATPILGYVMYYKMPVFYTNRDIQVAGLFLKDFFEDFITINGNTTEVQMQQIFLSLAALDANEQIITGHHYYTDNPIIAVLALGPEVEMLYVTSDTDFDIGEWTDNFDDIREHFAMANDDLLEKAAR